MKIGVVTISFPYRTESFTRREVCALRDLGHEMHVFIRQPTGQEPAAPMPENVALHDWNAMAFNRVDVLYTGIGFPSHRQALEAARASNTPFVFRIWSGLDTFRHPAPAFYSMAAADPLCLGCVVEDEFMREWAATKMGIPTAKLSIIPNSLDLTEFLERQPSETPMILACGRPVEKKGFKFLVDAARMIDQRIQVWIAGPDSMSNQPENVKCLGSVTAERLAELYSEAWALVAPSILCRDGDQDGIATVVLEAMAASCPVITSDVGSARCYIDDKVSGTLTLPGNAFSIAAAIDSVVQDQESASRMADKALEFAKKCLDIKSNVKALESVLSGSEAKRKGKLAAEQISRDRAKYTESQNERNALLTTEAFSFFKFKGDRILDVGCGDGSEHLFKGKNYAGVDIIAPTRNGFEFHLAEAENLPFPNETFESVLMYSTLQHFHNPEQAISEAARVLVPGGHLCASVALADGNPLFITAFTENEVTRLVGKYFKIPGLKLEGNRLLLNGVKR